MKNIVRNHVFLSRKNKSTIVIPHINKKNVNISNVYDLLINEFGENVKCLRFFLFESHSIKTIIDFTGNRCFLNFTVFRRFFQIGKIRKISKNDLLHTHRVFTICYKKPSFDVTDPSTCSTRIHG